MKNIVLVLIIVVLLPACISNKIKYIQDKDETFELIDEYANKPQDYKLQEKDILYVKITSYNKEVNEYFNLNNRNTGSNAQNSNFYLDGFTVNDSGYVQIPVLGHLKVLGLDMREVSELFQEKTDEHLTNAIVNVKLVSFFLSFLGEVNTQGQITVLQDNINILDAVALAGGISDYGNKRNVLVVRKTQNGTKTFHVDLTKRNLLTSDKFYLLPNDMVIVEPLRNKTFRMGISDYTMILSTLTSTITMILLIMNLKL
ncbi:MAG: polysaccharide biosynthesis/export family protein [Bacteroidota bacterium]